MCTKGTIRGPTLITTLDHIAASSIVARDWMFQPGLPQSTVLSPTSKVGDTVTPSEIAHATSNGSHHIH
jgi:hypothetical protein